MSFPRPVAPARPLAGWWTRGGALAIDLLITGVIEIALMVIAWVLDGTPRWTLAHVERISFELGLPVAVLYAPLFMGRGGHRNGQTIGKQAMGIRVVRQDGLPLSFTTALVREALGRQAPALLSSGLYVPVDYLWPLWDARHQALHDKVGRTFVVPATGAAPDSEPREELIRGGWLPPLAPTPERAGAAPGP
ncbi:MAG TPA: RDD family protein [Solirubrobacteraceae bacterium]|nr:RDD family protein [Solirubrobacteraceae bacterium]